MRDRCPNQSVLARPRAFQAIILAAFLAVLTSACAAKAPPPPPINWPSRVVTEEGMAFYVRKLRIPGTRQSLLLREGGASTWLPLNLIQILRFTGPEENGFRPVEIVLISGDKTKGEMDVTPRLEGVTDLGYWGVALRDVARLEIGME